MKRVFLLSLLFALILLTACGGTLSVAFDATPTPDVPVGQAAAAIDTQAAQSQSVAAQTARPLLGLDTDPEALRRALLVSHENWQTLWADGLVIQNSTQGSTTERVQVWIDRPAARFRVLSGPADGQPEMLQVSDGQQQARINLKDASRQEQEVSPAAHQPDWRAPEMISDTIEPHPLDLEIDSVLGESIFPAALAQRDGSFVIEGDAQIAGRPVLAATWWWNNLLRQGFWIDAQTGVILRMDSYDKQGASSEPVYRVQLDAIQYDLDLPDSLFSLELSEKPLFAQGPLSAGEPLPQPPQAVYNPNEGALYFVINRAPDAPQLAWLPGACLASSVDCPAPQVVAGYPNADSSILPLVWSPGKDMAALIVDGALYVYHPQSGEWNTVALFPILTGLPLWSPDGQWLVFSVLNDAGIDLYAVRSDGADLRNLTNGQLLEAENLWLEGWLADGRLLVSVINGGSARAASLEFMNAEGPPPPASVAPLPAEVAGFDTPYRVLAISTDGGMLAYSTSQENNAQIELVTYGADGQFGSPRRLASFQNAGVGQILFAPGVYQQPAEQWIAFLVRSGSSEADSVSTVYAMRADGSDLRQLFQSQTIQRLIFSADGARLIAEGSENGRLTVIPLTAPGKVVDAPGLRLDQPLSGASWR